MFRQNWFLLGWDYDETGKLVYKGDYYSFHLPPDFLYRIKVVTVAMSFTLFFLWLAVGALDSYGITTFVPMLCWFLSLVPQLYVLTGSIWLAAAKEPMTYRSFYVLSHRTRIALIATMALLGLCALGELIVLVLHFSILELEWMAGILLCLLICFGLFRLNAKYKPSIA